MKLKDAVNHFVAHKQSLGMDFNTSARLLHAFCKLAGDINIDDVQQNVVKLYIYGTGPVTSSLHSKLAALRGFFRYLVTREYITANPLPTEFPKEPERFTPYIYSQTELLNILNAAKRQIPRCKLEAHTFKALVLLLYGGALRLSEALRLTLADLDLEQSLLTIRDTKFFKTRWVPLSPDLTNAVQAYLVTRTKGTHPSPPEAFLLVTRESQPVSIQLAELSFERLCAVAGVRRTDGSRYGPRLHDLRHTFAVHRLIACYREGGDVQRLLPQLSTFLGHVDINCTQRYLTITPELLRHASKRFERYAQPGGAND